MMMELNTILLINLGSIGKRHLQNLLAIYPEATIVILRQGNASQEHGAVSQGDIIEVYTMNEALAYSPQAAIIASPSTFHVEQMQVLLKNKIHVFVEKPLSNSLKNIDSLITHRNANSLVVMVGYVLRFKAVVIKLKQLFFDGVIGDILHISVNCGSYLPDWREIQDYRNSVSAQKKLGGGVLLELSHEFDYLLWLLGEIDSLVAHVENSHHLDIDVEDIADIMIKFKIGYLATVHLDFLQKKPHRKLIISGTKGNIVCDIIDSTILVNAINSKPVEYNCYQDINEMYLNELRYFFQCIELKQVPSITIENGLEVLKVIQAINQSARQKQWVRI